MKRILLSLGTILVFATAWNQLEMLDINVVGQPSMSGPIQSNMEQPFFESLASTTGLPIKINYRSVDTLGFKDNRQLGLMKDGLADIVSLRFLQNSEVEPIFLGIDQPGLNRDFKTARAITQAYGPVVDATLQKRYDVKLLGIWPFGPQVFWCNRPIHQLSDLRGRKVRVGSVVLSPLIESLGGIPVVIPFDEVASALELRLVDCAVTSPISGYAAKWAAHVTDIYPIATQMGLNGIAIRLKVWNKLNADQQKRLTDAVNTYIASVWTFSEQLDHQATYCLLGQPSCFWGETYHLHMSPVTKKDLEFMHEFTHKTSLPLWANRCDQLTPGCSTQWKKLIEPVLHPDHP